jgi:uncharacterized protein YndB with AHSA1/START domain
VGAKVTLQLGSKQGLGLKNNVFLSRMVGVVPTFLPVSSFTSMALPDTQTKTRFVVEFPINASPKILFPYLATASGLTQWFCDDVRYVEGQRLNFIWDQENHYAEISGQRLNRAVRFVFLDDHRQPVVDANFLEFTLDSSQVTDEVYLRVVDYSAGHSEDEQNEMWEGLVAKLREQVGG